MIENNKKIENADTEENTTNSNQEHSEYGLLVIYVYTMYLSSGGGTGGGD